MDTNTLSDKNSAHYRKTACPWAVTVEFEHKFILPLISQNLHKEMKTLAITSQTTYGQQTPLHTLMIINNEKLDKFKE